MAGPLRIAFLGCGYITRVHSRHLSALGDRIAVAYASRDRSKADAYCREFRGAASYADYDAAIADPAVDAVVIAVPPRFHLPLTLQALEAGKHVLVEKPAYLRTEDYLTVRDAKARANRVVLVGENDHYKPLAVTLRRLLAEDAIGEMVFAHFASLARRLKTADDWRNDEAMAGGDAFFEEGIHWLHLAGSLGPRITRAHGYRPLSSTDGADRRVKSMMVAFEYDNHAVGSLYHSREVPSLLKGLRLSKLYGRDGIITFESNGAFVLARGKGWPRLLLPGVRDIRGYRAMYRDFVRAIRDGIIPEMTLERAIDDQRLMDQIYASLDSPASAQSLKAERLKADSPAMQTLHYDLVIIGTGAGGGTMARALADTGARILIVERGDVVPAEDANWSPLAVWKDGRDRSTELWLNADGREFAPLTHYNVGGNTKFWGSVLYRLRREDFMAVEHADGLSPAWPIDYEMLAPYYAEAERLYQVHGGVGDDPTEPPRDAYPYPAIRHSPEMAAIIEQLRGMGLHPSPLPLGLIAPGETGGCQLCGTCNSFPCKLGAKSDAESCGVRHATRHANVTLWTNTFAGRLIASADGRRVDAVEVTRPDGPARVSAPVVVASCGAVNSAALLLRSGDRHPDGLANSSGLVGRRYMAHMATMMQGFHPWRVNHTVFQKTVAINDFYLRGPDSPYPLGQIQSQGRTHGVMAKVVGDTIVPGIPLGAYDWWVERGVDWLAMSEDLPSADNRVTVTSDGRIRLAYRPNNVTAHAALVREAKRILRRLGFWIVMTHSHQLKNTTHQCGTLCFGTDPRTSVLDPYRRAHDLENLFVVDASFFPSSAAVNPGLTIAAQALRVAEHIRTRHLR